MTIIRAMLPGSHLTKIQAALQMTGQAVTKKWSVKINRTW